MILPHNVADVSFRLGASIGQEGRNSQVFMATDLHLDAEIVMKQMEKSKLNFSDFFTEAQILYKSAHPYIVPIHYACQDDKYIYIAMPFYKNGSLKRKMDRKRLTCKEVIRYSIHFLSGLHNIHSKGLVHLDIKPDNILLSDRDEATLTDFGLSKNLDENGEALLTRHYVTHLAPEVLTQVAGKAPVIDRTYDIYQAGVTIYRMLVGNESFYTQRDRIFEQGGVAAIKSAIAAGNFPNRDILPVHVPRALKNIVKKCLSQDPADRYPSALELSNALSKVSVEGCSWQVAFNDNETIYTKDNDDGSGFLVEVLANQSCLAYTVNKNGTKRRIVAMCKDRVTDRELYYFLMSK